MLFFVYLLKYNSSFYALNPLKNFKPMSFNSFISLQILSWDFSSFSQKSGNKFDKPGKQFIEVSFLFSFKETYSPVLITNQIFSRISLTDSQSARAIHARSLVWLPDPVRFSIRSYILHSFFLKTKILSTIKIGG